jgi:hypothetical protein
MPARLPSLKLNSPCSGRALPDVYTVECALTELRNQSEASSRRVSLKQVLLSVVSILAINLSYDQKFALICEITSYDHQGQVNLLRFLSAG